jgi:predicted Zn-dependent protease with MMP-like domain
MLNTRLNEARLNWGTALGRTTISTAAHANANIQVYGGSLGEMQDASGTEGLFAGRAISAYRTAHETLTIDGIPRTVYRLSGQARIFITYYNARVHQWAQRRRWTAGEVRTITVHELGHALGWRGHSTDNTDVMYGYLIQDAEGDIQPEEARHLRQIYDMFRLFPG